MTRPTRLRIFDDGPRPGAVNMRRDAALLAAHRAGEPPVLRLYRWAPPAVSCGYHQSEADFDAAAIAARGFGLTRRPTGGRAILHAEELTYAVVGDSPCPLFGSTLHETYTVINSALLRFLRELGLHPDVSGGETRAQARGPVCFQSAGEHELTVNGRKLAGSAQRRGETAFLQHGSILAGPRHAELVELLAPARRGRQTTAGVRAVTTDLGALLGRPLPEPELVALGRRLADAFCAALALAPAWEPSPTLPDAD